MSRLKDKLLKSLINVIDELTIYYDEEELREEVDRIITLTYIFKK